jgi:hypothetical protein
LRGEPRVIDKEVDGPRIVAQTVGHPLNLFPVGQIGGEHFHVYPIPLAKSNRYRVESADVPGDKDKPVPFGGEAPREGVPDPRGRPSHERSRQGSLLSIRRLVILI